MQSSRLTMLSEGSKQTSWYSRSLAVKTQTSWLKVQTFQALNKSQIFKDNQKMRWLWPIKREWHLVISPEIRQSTVTRRGMKCWVRRSWASPSSNSSTTTLRSSANPNKRCRDLTVSSVNAMTWWSSRTKSTSTHLYRWRTTPVRWSTTASVTFLPPTKEICLAKMLRSQKQSRS